MNKHSNTNANIRELIVQLNRGNGAQAMPLLEMVHGDLKAILHSGMDKESGLMLQAQQTMFAIEEVRILLGESNMRGALAAARDAGKEWQSIPAASRE